MVRFLRRKSAPKMTREEQAEYLDGHPDVVRADMSLMDSETREMYRDARDAEQEWAERPTNEKVQRFFTLNNPFKVGFIVTLGALAAILFGQALGQLSTIVVYVIAAMFIALGLDPVVRRLERTGVKRPIGIAIVFGGFIVVIGALLAIIVPMISRQIAQFVQTAPEYFFDVQRQEWFMSLDSQFGHLIDFNELVIIARDFVGDPDNWAQVAGGVWQAGIGIVNGVTATLIVLILSLYFLSSLQIIKRGMYSLSPRSARAKVMDITEQVTKSIGGYVNGMVILAFINAVLGFIAMTIFDVPFAGLLAVLVFLLALIPLIGSVLATILVTVAALFNSPITAISIAIYYLIYMQVESYLFTPRIMHRVVSVPGSLVVIGALAGGTLLGLLGALISIPITAMVLMIIKQVWVPRQELR